MPDTSWHQTSGTAGGSSRSADSSRSSSGIARFTRRSAVASRRHVRARIEPLAVVAGTS